MTVTYPNLSTTSERAYENQAISFLKDTHSTLSVSFSKYGKYFYDDKKSRNIYSFTLKNKGRSYSAEFGQSINASERNEFPNAYDILSCLDPFSVSKDAEMSEDFQEFCENFGYEIKDLKQAMNTFDLCCEEVNALHAMYCDEQLQALSDVQ